MPHHGHQDLTVGESQCSPLHTLSLHCHTHTHTCPHIHTHAHTYTHAAAVATPPPHCGTPPPPPIDARAALRELPTVGQGGGYRVPRWVAMVVRGPRGWVGVVWNCISSSKKSKKIENFSEKFFFLEKTFSAYDVTKTYCFSAASALPRFNRKKSCILKTGIWQCGFFPQVFSLRLISLPEILSLHDDETSEKVVEKWTFTQNKCVWWHLSVCSPALSVCPQSIFWVHFGIILASFWVHFGAFFLPILDYFAHFLAHTWAIFTVILRVFFFADVWCKIEQNRCEGRQTYANFCQNDAKLCQKMSFFACKTRVLLQNPS